MSALNNLTTSTIRLGALALALSPTLCLAAAPIYFDIAGLLLYGIVAAILFVVLVVALFRTKSKATRTICLLGLLSYIVVPIVLRRPSYQVQEKGASWTLRERERSEVASAAEVLVVGLCQKNAVEIPSPEVVVGLRLLEEKPISELGARGWPTGLAFFVGGTNAKGSDNPSSVVEGLKNSMRQLFATSKRDGKGPPPFFEYQSADGQWMRYAVKPPAVYYVEEEARAVEATHGIRFKQHPSGYEETYKLYAGSIEVVNLLTKEVVARHFSYAHDRYWGAHNHYSLFAGEHCKGLPLGEDFLTNWLRPLVGLTES